MKNLNIAVLSGKGGTGKTTVSTNIALALNANYIDCDVEEPNGFLFLKPNIDNIENVLVDYPIIDLSNCISCGQCVNTCQFNALAKVNEDILVFEKLCHSCGTCELVCCHGAINYEKRNIGKIENGFYKNIKCSRGILNIGEPMAVPIIKQLLSNLLKELNIIDCPPGTSCNVVNSLRYADMAILVTEPTEFGLHDLRLAIDLVKTFNIPYGIILNKDDGKKNIIREYSNKNNIGILGTIPYEKDIAIEYSKGNILYDNLKFKYLFEDISKKIREELQWN